MRAIILAAGRGSRLRRLTDNQPKCLVELGGQPLLAWQVQALRSSGVSDIIVISGYCSSLIDDYAKALRFRTRQNTRWNDTNMLASLFTAEDLIDNPCIVSYSDIVYDSDIVEALINVSSPLAIAYDPDWESLWRARFEDPLDDAESFEIGSDGRVYAIGARVDNLTEIQGQYVGLNRITPESLQWMREIMEMENISVDTLDMTSILGMLIKHQYPIDGVPITSGWCEIDSERDLEVADSLLSSKQLQLPITPKK